MTTKCDGCGAVVSDAYARVFRRRDSSLPECIECHARTVDSASGAHVGVSAGLWDVVRRDDDGDV